PGRLRELPVLLSFEFFARRDDLWGRPLGCGRPLRRPVRAPGFAKVASMPAWEAGAAQGAAPQIVAARWRPRPSSSSPSLRLAAMRGRLQPAEACGGRLARPESF